MNKLEIQYKGILLVILILCFGLTGLNYVSSEDKIKKEKNLAEEMVRLPFVPPEKAASTLTVQKGFQMQLSASEPMVSDPLSACFDENGWMFVTEMHGYPFSHDNTKLNPSGGGKKEAGIVRLLIDENHDGVMDKSFVYADKLNWPTSVCCYNGGVFVVAPPNLHYFKDTNGDHVADVREIVLSGFDRGNVQAIANSLIWGLDNHIYFVGGLNGGELIHRGKKLFKSRGSAIRFNPEKEIFEQVAGRSQFGMSFDDWGNRFTCSNSSHIRQVIYDEKYLNRNSYFSVSGIENSIAAEGAAAPVFRKSPAEPWRVVRTRRRNADPRYKNLRGSERVPIGFFTSATSVTVYRGAAYPQEFRGNAFIGDVGGNLIHRKTLKQGNTSLVATRADKNVEFVASNDTWFRPLNYVNAPDGTLYVLDMYRETIEHPYSIPEDIKSFLRLESGDDRGRIWRLVSPDMKNYPVLNLREMTDSELVKQLNSSNSWNRETAQRLLVQRNAVSVSNELIHHFHTIIKPLGRLHILYTLQGLNKLNIDILEVGLNDLHPGIREHSLKLSEKYLKDSHGLSIAVLKMVNDPDKRVKQQLAFTLGEMPEEESMQGLEKLFTEAASVKGLRVAWLSSVYPVMDQLSLKLFDKIKPSSGTAQKRLLAELVGMIASKKDNRGTLGFLTKLAGIKSELADKQIYLVAIGKGLSRNGQSISKLINSVGQESKLFRLMNQLFETAIEQAEDDSLSANKRLAATKLLAFGNYSDVSGTLIELLEPSVQKELQIESVKSLSEYNEKEVGVELLGAWRGLTPSVRREVLDKMVQRKERILYLLDSIEQKRLQASEIERDKQQLLVNHPQKDIREKARKIFGSSTSESRGKIVSLYEKSLEKSGVAKRGHELYKKHCSTCHKYNKEGYQVGPDLVSVTNKSPNDLIIAILDPNKEAQPAFLTYSIATTQAKLFSGIIASETGASIVLKRAEGKQDSILRSNIESMVSNGKSLMPEGMEKELNIEQMADIIAFIKNIKAPVNSAPVKK
jgi:putative membrane-bound dehydrogenase-like protein